MSCVAVVKMKKKTGRPGGEKIPTKKFQPGSNQRFQRVTNIQLLFLPVFVLLHRQQANPLQCCHTGVEEFTTLVVIKFKAVINVRVFTLIALCMRLCFNVFLWEAVTP